VTIETKNRSGKKKPFNLRFVFKYPTNLPEIVGQFVVEFLYSLNGE
jgi:hypothetical protein